jgi:hypothetical protein
MNFKLIKSRKEKPQILHSGYRLTWNKGPKGEHASSYFKCVNCTATAGTTGPLEDGQVLLKFHNVAKHTCQQDVSSVLAAETMANFRTKAKTCPDKPAKVAFEEIATEVLNSASTPNKEDLAQKLSTYQMARITHGHRLRSNSEKLVN